MSPFSTHLLHHAQATALDPDLTEEARVAATNQALESLLAVRAPEPVASILAARVAAAHLAMMECLRRAMRRDVGVGSATALRGKAALLPKVADSFVRTLEQTKGPEPYRDAILAWDVLADPVPPAALPPGLNFSDQHDPMPGEEAVSAAIAALFSSQHHPMPGETPVSDRFGPLRNGNPRRDLRTLPCCGARTRAALPCRQPAMRNGRCRMHGGASTGARTEAGRDALRAKARTHGFHTAEGKHFFRLIHALQATARLLNQARNLPVVELELFEARPDARPYAGPRPAATRPPAKAPSGGSVRSRTRLRDASSGTNGARAGKAAPGVRVPGWRDPGSVECPLNKVRRMGTGGGGVLSIRRDIGVLRPGQVDGGTRGGDGCGWSHNQGRMSGADEGAAVGRLHRGRSASDPSCDPRGGIHASRR